MTNLVLKSGSVIEKNNLIDINKSALARGVWTKTLILFEMAIINDVFFI